MNIKTEQLTAINNAINAVLGGAQEYRLGSKMVRRADLSILLEERSKIELEIKSETDSSYIVPVLHRR